MTSYIVCLISRLFNNGITYCILVSHSNLTKQALLANILSETVGITFWPTLYYLIEFRRLSYNTVSWRYCYFTVKWRGWIFRVWLHISSLYDQILVGYRFWETATCSAFVNCNSPWSPIPNNRSVRSQQLKCYSQCIPLCAQRMPYFPRYWTYKGHSTSLVITYML